MRALLWTVLLTGCDPKGNPAPAGEECHGQGCEEQQDTSPEPPAEDTAPQDTAPPEDTGDSGDSGDTAEPEKKPEPACETATFTDLEGNVTDMTETFLVGSQPTIKQAGTLAFCPGTWYVRLTIAADLAVVGLGGTREETVLSGGEQGVVLRLDGDLALSVENVTLDRGASYSLGGDNGGGAVNFTQGGDVTLTNVVISNNRGEDGGGVHGRPSGGSGHSCSFTASDVHFLSNAGTDEASAMYLSNCDADLVDVTFEDNGGAEAGGAFTLWTGTAEVSGSAFTGNESNYAGGAIFLLSSTLSVEDSTFTDNAANGQGIGGALFSSGSEVFLEEVRFEGNHAKRGGAIANYTDSYLEITSCDFVDNDPDDLVSANESNTGLSFGMDASYSCEGDDCEEE